MTMSAVMPVVQAAPLQAALAAAPKLKWQNQIQHFELHSGIPARCHTGSTFKFAKDSGHVHGPSIRMQSLKGAALSDTHEHADQTAASDICLTLA